MSLLLGVLLVSMNIFAQEIKQVINYGWDLGKDDPNIRRGFVAQITYDSLPEVNKTSRIFVKIRSKSRHENAPGFRIRGFPLESEYTQLEPEWYPPLDPEYIYEGSFTITPREIGRYSFSIRARGEPFRHSSHHDFGLHLTIGESGKAIHFSDKPDFVYDGTPSHPPVGPDEVCIRSEPHGDFKSYFCIMPPLSFNDTSIIYVELESKRYCPEGVQFCFKLTSNLEMITIPPSWLGEIKEGDVYKDSFEITPTSTDLAFLSVAAQGNSPSKDVYDKRRGVAMATFDLHFSFDSSGKLDYVGRKDKYYRSDKAGPAEIAARLGEEYRVPKGAIKKLWSEPLIPIRRTK